MSKVMRDWEDLEKKYQLMKNGGNGEEAETFKKSVTLRFQKTIKNLEDEGNAEKRQLLAVHQQRVGLIGDFFCNHGNIFIKNVTMQITFFLM